MSVEVSEFREMRQVGREAGCGRGAICVLPRGASLGTLGSRIGHKSS